MSFKFLGLLDSCTIFGKSELDLIEKHGIVGISSEKTVLTADGTLHLAICLVDISHRVKARFDVIPILIIHSFSNELILKIDFLGSFQYTYDVW